MIVWSNFPTILKQRHALRIAGLLALCVALITTQLFALVSHAAPGVNQTLSFQGRLLSSGGSVVPDGYYNIQFKIYQDGAGTTAGNTGGTLKWTETYINNGGSNAVEVRNGYFSINLGSVNPFGSNVDWNQDTLWLSMNIAGSSTSCTSFGSSPCTADGEMLPMKRITSTPYSLNSGQLGGKTASQFTQLGQGVQTDTTSNSSIFINKTSSGNLLQLQNMTTDVFTIANTGDVIFGNSGNHSLSVGTSPTSTAGYQLTLAAGSGGSGSGSSGGKLVLQGGDGGGTNGNGGDISIDAGIKTGAGTAGAISIGESNAGTITIGSSSNAISQTINIGTNNTAGGTSNVTIGAGNSATSGTTTIQSKNDTTITTNGVTRMTLSGSSNTAYFGNGVTAISPNNFTIQGTGSSTTAVTGGALTIKGGDATVGDANGGNVTLSGGNGNGSGVSGLVILNTPTFSTVTNDANCYTSGASVSTNCTVALASVDGSSAMMLGFSATGKVATLPSPTITTPGRVIYIMVADGSKDFTLSMNGGGTGNLTTMRQNTAATLMWNGAKWLIAGISSSSGLMGNNSIDGNIPNVQIGDGAADDQVSLLTLDKAPNAPTVTNTSAMLGSMYYDTTLGKVQCYEADGWGACGAPPDIFITLSPEYSNAVMNGTDIGTISSDLCSDTLNINDGSAGQPTICGTNETFNFYKWTSGESSNQTRSIYVTYQLPSNFKNFASGTTSLMGRTDSVDSSVTYQIYKDHSGSALASCGSAVSVSTGSQSTWQKATATGSADPSNCSFAAGDSILIRINLTAKNNTNAYISNLNFVYSNN